MTVINVGSLVSFKSRHDVRADPDVGLVVFAPIEGGTAVVMFPNAPAGADKVGTFWTGRLVVHVDGASR